MNSKDKHPPKSPAAGTFYNLFAPQSAGSAHEGERQSKVSLRQRAEAHFLEREELSSEKLDELSPESMRTILHELRVHQIELEMQNEELTRAQAELDASRSRYFDLYDLAPVGYITVSEKGLILEANLMAVTLLGVDRVALVKQPISRVLLKEDQDIYYKHRQLLVETGRPQQFELRMVKPDGTKFWAQLSATAAAQGEAGAPSCRVALIDVTERKQAEEALRETDGRMRAITNSAQDSIIMMDSHGLISYWNPASESIFGYRSEEAIGKNLHQLLVPEPFLSTHLAAFPAFQRTGCGNAVGKTVEMAACHKDGREISVALSLSAVSIKGEWHSVGIVRDITGRKRMEDVQSFLARTSSGTAADPFFSDLARYLARSLGADFICIDLLEGDALHARTLAVWCDGRFEDNVTYALKDTPCGDVVGKDVCCFPASVCQFFPRDQVLQELRAESYIGITLWSHDGRPIGLIAAIGRSPLTNRDQAEATLKLVAERASGELERLLAETALRESEETYHRLFENMAEGCSYCRMIFEDGRPQDWIYLSVNSAFETLTGLKDVAGKRVTEVIPGIRENDRELFETYARVSQTGTWAARSPSPPLPTRAARLHFACLWKFHPLLPSLPLLPRAIRIPHNRRALWCSSSMTTGPA
ncbi:MAG: PAS domain S-box protein [Verrucomicrobiaceae bacterium]|nr:MAG: PAS domain S-box protein [Verrucomicrobiaceae bacterium]